MYNKSVLIVAFFFSFMQLTEAQTRYYFHVSLKDKNNNLHTLSAPVTYLSTKAIARRAAFNVPIDSTDLPVNEAYIAQIVALSVQVNNRSKWLNSITVHMTDSSIAQQIRALPFVKNVQYTGLRNAPYRLMQRAKKTPQTTIDYGTANNQTLQMKANYLHQLGFTGRGVVVAVIDAGFENVDVNAAFDSLRVQGRLLGTKDFAVPGSDVFREDDHGANVLSILTGRYVGATPYSGTAPHASFWLIRTEYAQTEYLNEVDFWVSGIEFADSVGADVVNSSLGYTTFDDARMNYRYEQMNGKVSRASIAATMAASKGMLVCNSAGNEGSLVWKYIGAPADAFNIFAVGSNDAQGILPSSFTSYGPSADGRMKPEISAQGSLTALINFNGVRTQSNGTSYSSPAFAGALASLLQYYKSLSTQLSVATIRDAVLQSGHLYNNPSTRLGYGIPNFETAHALLNAQLTNAPKTAINTFARMHFGNNELRIVVSDNSAGTSKMQLLTIDGKMLFAQQLLQYETVLNIAKLQPGLYIVRLQNGNGQVQTLKFVKN